MKNVFLTFLSLFCAFSLFSQEIKMNVTVKTQEIKTVDPRVFKSLERQVNEFFNNTQWTEDEFEEEEKIEADFQITITNENSTTSFTADFVIQVIRPVYGSNYSTQIFNHIEKGINFSYQEFQPIQNNSEIYTDNLSSILTYYAHIIIGSDYDTFSSQGGDSNFEIARQIVNNIPTSNGDASWSSAGGLKNTRSRYKLITDILSPSVIELREAMYEYHRLGLDQIGVDPVKARAAISGSLQKIRSVDMAFPNSMIVKIFCDSKLGELVEIYKPSSAQEKKLIYNILVKLDPAQSDKIVDLK